jgi:hypothetical protein
MTAFGPELTAWLYACVPGIEDRALRRTVLSAQRAIFHGEALPEGTWWDRLSADEARIAALRDYAELGRQYLVLQHARDAAFESQAREKMAAVARLLRTDVVRLGLMMANPRLARLLEGLDACVPPSKRARRALIRGFRYLLRATLKPVPFSFLATTSVVEVTESASDVKSTAPLSQVALNREVLHAIAAALLAHRDIRKAATIEVAATLHGDSRGCWVLDPRQGEQYLAVNLPAGLRERLQAARLGSLDINSCSSPVGISDALCDDLLDQGVLTANLVNADDALDDLEKLTRILWQAAAADLACLSIIAQLERLSTALRCAASHDPEARASALAACEDAVRSLPGGDVEARAIVFEDVATAETAGVRPEAWRDFLNDVAAYGAPLPSSEPSDADEALAEVHDELFPQRAYVPFLEFHRRYLAFCAKHGFGSDPRSNARDILAWRGRHFCDPVDAVVAELTALTADANGEVCYRPVARRAQPTASDSVNRLSIRFAPAPLGPSGPRFQLLFWGADQMSLFPRYARLPGAGAQRLRAAFAEWMARWPLVADMYSSFGRSVDVRPVLTQRIIEAPDTAFRSGAIRLSDLTVARASVGRRLLLLDRDGQQVKPIFLGVSSPARLPGIVRLLTFLAGRRGSVLEMVAEAISRIIWAAMARSIRSPRRLPAIYLGDHVLLSPAALVFDPGSLLPRCDGLERETFFAIHDWLADHDLPPVARIQSAQGSLGVDLRNPLGVDSFLRFIRHSDSALIEPVYAGDAADGGEWRSREYYVELAAE